MCILVSARLQATAAPEAPAPMIRTSTGSFFIQIPSSLFRHCERCAAINSDFGLRVRLLRIAPRNDGSIDNPTGSARIPRMKFEHSRCAGPMISNLRSRCKISSQRMPICCSASRSPTQRWMPAPKARCCRGLARSTMNSSARSIFSSSRLPEMYHITTLSPFAICGRRVRRRCARCGAYAAPGSGSGWSRRPDRDQFAPAAHQLELLGIFDQRHQPAGHGIARGVVAADDQQRDRADEFARLQIWVAGECASIEIRSKVGARVGAGIP